MDGADLLRWGAVGVITLVVLVTALVVVGFVALFRRRGDAGIRRSGPTGLDELSTRAGSLLLRLDDAVRAADQELGYAIAQFGPDRARTYGEALGDAREKVAEAFRIKQALDDAYPESDRLRREWTNQVIALCEQAQRSLADQDAEFAKLRRLEVDAAATLNDVRSRAAELEPRIASVREALAALRERFDSPALDAVNDRPDAAAAALAEARSAASAAEPGITASGVSAVSDTLERARQAVHRAGQLLDEADAAGRDVEAAAAALEARRASTRADLAEAKTQRDAAPDADTGEAIIHAIAGVESALEADSRDPVAALGTLNAALDALDLALASARNQAQRLEHARLAYEGTLVSARSQIAAAKAVIGRAGVEARTRLAEAERQLMLAQAATDPVEALDTVRRAVTHARDAEDLARFDLS